MRVGEISTERLILRHSDQDRDGWKFLMMLEEEGDFRIFTGVEYSEKYRDDFLDYFEVTHGNRCYYSLFPKEDPEKFIGYAGFHTSCIRGNRDEKRYELEFYVSRKYRNKGYCAEAAKNLIELLFAENIEIDGDGCKVTPDEVYAKTLSRNFPAIRVLEKLAFIKSDESPATIMSEFVDFEDEESCLELISEYKLENKNCVTD